MVEDTQVAEARRSGAPTREYMVLELIEFDDDDRTYFAVAHKVEARNGTNALRRAFKEIRAERNGTEDAFDETTLAVVPMSQWKPTPVRAKRRESITVDIG